MSDATYYPHPARALALWSLVLVLGMVLAGCGEPDAPEATEPRACTDEVFPAVEIEVVDVDGEPLIGAGMRYRVDEGEWQDWPENLGRSTVIRGGPGRYELEVGKQGYEGQATTLDVAAEAEDGCRPVVQRARLQLAQTPCPEAPAALSLTIDPPQSGLEASARIPGAGRQQLACREPAGEACGAFAFDVLEPGDYGLTLKGLPGLGAMKVVSDVISYESIPVDLRLEHRGATDMTGAGGSEMVEYRFQVALDEANCPLADFRTMETTYSDGGPANEAGDPDRRPPLAVRYLGGLTMTDLGAEACRAEPVLTALPFGVDLPAGTNPAEVEMFYDYGEGWLAAECELREGEFICLALTPNPLVNRPFVAQVTAEGESATGFSVPFGGLCLIFE